MGFKDLWKDQFKKTKTHDDNFTKLDGTISKKSMMYLNANTSVYKNRIMVVVRLPYSNQLSMVIAAPVYKGKGKPLSPISIDMISAIDKVYNNKQKKNVEVEIPKFSVQTSLDMHDSFSKLGMKHVFGDTGEFTDATDSPFQLDRAISQTAIMISEEGAVINTGKEVKTDREMSLSKKEQKNKRTNNKKSNKRNNNHKFNTPFVFAIVDDSTRSIIFLGQIVDPQI